MSKFALKYPFFIIMICRLVSLVGVVTTVQMHPESPGAHRSHEAAANA